MQLDKLEKAFNEMFDFITDLPSGLDGFESDFDAAYKELIEAKSADVAPVVHGKWKHDENVFDDEWSCSSCHKAWTFIDGTTPEENNVKYCPNCGAKMDLEEDE